MPLSVADLAQSMAAAWNAGDAEHVIKLAAQAPGVGADDERILALLAVAQQATGRVTQAAESFERLTRKQPHVSAWWNNLGVVGRDAGDLATAERALTRAMGLAPRDAEVRYNLGLLYIQQRSWPQARQALLDAARLAPQFIDARLHAAYACHVCGDSNSEEAMLEGAGNWPPQPAEQALILAGMLSVQGNLDAALRTLERARLPTKPEAVEPMRLRINAQRTLLYERNNQLAGAQHELQNLPLPAIDALPADESQARVDGWRAHAALALRADHAAEAADLYQRALELVAEDESRANLAFGLATALDRQARCAEAWQALESAHAAQRDIVRGAAPELLQPDARTLPVASRTVDAQAYAAWTPLNALDARHSPVFVIGFPRSGTTLLEQMLDAHPDFQSMDERGFVYDLIERMEHAGQSYPADLASLSQTDADQLRVVYDHMVARVLPDLGGRRLVDKNPLNMLCLPMILRLFPEARIILCLRHPCDVLLSCYMQSFRSPSFMVVCSSLEHLARGYAQAFEQCCRHVEVFKPNILEWRYESAVGDLDGEIARLGHFLDIADASPTRDFAEHAQRKQFIATPSYAQVTRPVNAAAVGRWQAYREHFEPVLPVLRPWIERFGYMT